MTKSNQTKRSNQNVEGLNRNQAAQMIGMIMEQLDSIHQTEHDKGHNLMQLLQEFSSNKRWGLFFDKEESWPAFFNLLASNAQQVSESIDAMKD